MKKVSTIRIPGDAASFKIDVIPSPPDDRDYLVSALPAEELPEMCDYTDDMWPVRHQGNQGSCAAQTASCMKEWQEKKDVGLIGQGLSAQFVYNNRENKDTSGMYGRNVMSILKDIGIVEECDYPYYSTDPITQDLLDKAKNFVISGYARINTINELKQALVKNGPCYISVPVYDHGDRMWKPKEPGQERIGGHAMTVIGYGSTGFLLRNSWGRLWANDGYCMFPYEDWGCQFEVWTTIDADTADIIKPKKEEKKLNFFQKTLRFICLFISIGKWDIYKGRK